MRNARLTELAARRLRAADLPPHGRVATSGGASQGGTCGLCRSVVRAGEPEIELVWIDATVAGDASRRHAILHPACHGAWLALAHATSCAQEPESTTRYIAPPP
jgi:hypothetical protein